MRATGTRPGRGRGAGVAATAAPPRAVWSRGRRVPRAVPRNGWGWAERERGRSSLAAPPPIHIGSAFGVGQRPRRRRRAAGRLQNQNYTPMLCMAGCWP